jgi:hypothetical protein
MKAHENNKIAMSQIQKLEKEILSNKGVWIPPKIFHTLALFWSKSMTLPSGAVRDLIWQYMEGKSVPRKIHPYPKTPDKLFRGRMIERRQNSQICFGKEPLTNF